MTSIIVFMFVLFITTLLFILIKDFMINFVEMAWESLHSSSYLEFKKKQSKKKKLKKSKASQ